MVKKNKKYFLNIFLTYWKVVVEIRLVFETRQFFDQNLQKNFKVVSLSC